jgi:16S rRNA (uracil1498-N3)-methyltransferase
VNLLLVEPGEVTDDLVVLADRRAAHLHDVLGVRPGSRLRAGMIGGNVGIAEVLAIEHHRESTSTGGEANRDLSTAEDGIEDDHAAARGRAPSITLRLALVDRAPSPLPIEIVLAVPRPKVLARVVETLASFAVERIALTNAWRVDKSYLRSPRLAPEALAHAARLGAEQGVTTHLPAITQHDRLMALLDERWPAGGASSRVQLIAHPGGVPIEQAVGEHANAPMTLAIGPEGGWIAREVETFVARGFTAVSLGSAILRVETAVAVALGQLALLRRQLIR